MNSLLFWTSTLLRPDDDVFSSEERSEIQLHRLLTLLGAVLLLGYGFLYAVQNPMGATLVWLGLGLAAAFVGLLVGSYEVERLRQNYVTWVHGALYAVLGWTVILAYLNHFAGDYVADLLVVYATFTVVMGIGVRSVRPVLWYLGSGLVGTALTTVFTIAPYTSPLVLLMTMATVAIVEGLAIYGYLSIRGQLREREARLRGLTNSVPGVVFQFLVHPDDTWENTFVSNGAESLLGIPATPSTFYERFLDHVPSSYREELADSVTQAVDQRRQWRFEMPFDRRDGTRLWLLGISTPEIHDDTVVFNGAIFDVTDRKRTERRLQECERKAEALCDVIERLPEAESPETVAQEVENVVQTTLDPSVKGIHLECGGMPETRTDSSAASERIASTQINDPEADPLDAQVSQSSTSDGPTDRDASTQENDETTVPLGTHGVMSVRSSETDTIDLFDIKLLNILGAHAGALLDRIEQETALIEARDTAEAAHRFKSRMLTNISHEIRTPMTAITGLSEILTMRCEGKSAHLSEQIHQSSQRLMDTIESVLELSELEAGTYAMEPERVDLNNLVAEAVDEHRASANEQSVSLEINLPNTPVQGTWNEDGIRRIVDNLLDNAIKFSPPDGTVTLRISVNHDDALLVVRDTGIGMSPDAVPDVFAAFKQESDGLCREYEGSGLGLTIVRELVELFDGDIRVETEKGEGTRVRVRLPQLSVRPNS